MKIESMQIIPTTMSLTKPIPMSSGVISSTNNVVVRLVTTDGIVGWGEGVEAPALTGQRQADIVADLEALEDEIVGADPMNRSELWTKMGAILPAGTTAKGAVDIALHDIAGKSLDMPIHRLLGGAHREAIPGLTLVGSGDHAADVDTLAAKRDLGYRWFKIKLGMGAEEDELATIARAIELTGLDGVVCGDANEGWDEAGAISFLENLEGMGVRFVEQPVAREDPKSLMRVAEHSPVAICADESAGSLEAVAGFAGTEVGGVSLKLIKHGGITGVMRGAAICTAGGLEINVAGKVVESSISAAANLHAAAAVDTVGYGCSPGNQGVEFDLVDEPLAFDNGSFVVPSGPGLGIEVSEARLKRLAS